MSKKARASLSAITNFDIAVEMKIHALISSKRYNRITDPEFLFNLFERRRVYNEGLLKRFIDIIVDFKSLRAKAVHQGFLTLSILSKFLVRELTDFILHEIIKNYYDSALDKLISDCFRREKIVVSSKIENIELYEDLLESGLLIKIFESIEWSKVNENLYGFFKILDGNEFFKNKTKKGETYLAFSPLLLICARQKRTSERIIHYIKRFWSSFPRFRVRHSILLEYNPTNYMEYLRNLIDYARVISRAKANKNYSHVELDLLWTGIANELRLIIVKSEVLYKKGLIRGKLLEEVLKALLIKIPKKTNESYLIFKEFFNNSLHAFNISYASFLSEASLLHIIESLKGILAPLRIRYRGRLRNTLFTHINNVNPSFTKFLK